MRHVVVISRDDPLNVFGRGWTRAGAGSVGQGVVRETPRAITMRAPRLLVKLPEEVEAQGPKRHGHRRQRGSDRNSIHEAWSGSQRKHSPRPTRLSGGTQRTPDPDQLLEPFGVATLGISHEWSMRPRIKGVCPNRGR